MKFDVAIVGAGAAGLAAARELSGAGKSIVLLEARPRAGGRIHTLHFDDLPVPIELGAEFVHGDVASTFSIVDAASLTACTLPDDHWFSRGGRRTRIADFWGTIDRVRKRISSLRRDISFDEFLRTRRFPPRVCELARMFVEGYHASHADRISALALASSDEEQEGTQQQSRLLDGYDAVIAWLRAGINADRAQLRFSTVVTAIEWRDGDVRIRTSSETFRARAAILTIPIGVWKAGDIRFDPALEEKERAIAKLESGHVVKIMFRFRERFWDDVNFLHANDRYMPTWWTSAPVRSPVLTGWAGGHAADRLLAEGGDAIVDRALDAMAAAFDVSRRMLDAQLVSTWTHDWQRDPFSRGAYSYAGVGGSGAHDALAKPVARTLFFAGEATSSDQTGTVAGAIDSGRRAAREVLRMFTTR